MIESIILDILLVLVMVLMMTVGAYRGGLREGYSAAGVVLGVLLAQEWAESWGNWIGQNTSLSDGGARFTVSLAILIMATVAVGYGVGVAFNYHPGPGSRMFGVVLGGGSALVAIAYVLTWLRRDLFGSEAPEVVNGTWIARFLDGDAGLVLLVVSGAIVAAALFGALVRERDDDAVDAGQGAAVAAASGRQPGPAGTAPDKVEPKEEPAHGSSTVRVRPPQQWEDRSGTMPSRDDREWSHTWPSDAPGVPDQEHPVRAGQVQRARDRRKQS